MSRFAVSVWRPTLSRTQLTHGPARDMLPLEVPMRSADKIRSRLEALDERLARLRAERERLAADRTQAERRRHFHRKIVIGAAVLAAVEQDGMPALQTRADLLAWLDGRVHGSHDREVFELAPRPNPIGEISERQ